jgi:hypothetical protein
MSGLFSDISVMYPNREDDTDFVYEEWRRLGCYAMWLL